MFPFENNAITGRERLDFLEEWLADSVAGRIRESGELRVVERRELLRILQEQKLGSSDLASKESRLRLGRLVGAQTMVFGGFIAISDVLQLDARIVDTESGLVLKTVNARGEASGVRELADELGSGLVRGLGLEVARRTVAAGLVDERALRSAELYYEGLGHEKAGRTDAAVEAYRRALELNGKDREARERLKVLLAAP